ncbi:carbamoyl-phosphate synthase large subunit [Candidatus Sumerlaeota bacterium]|nr:carbamoyl-phosphate synthase large subunit [Candidatus Sumerlaeota bacterium]
MPKRTDIKRILIIGSGPIIIGQACEFDYSGTQGCKALKEEGYEVILINSNPATIMTDPQFGDRTYIEPLTLDFAREIIKKERPDALLPTLGGQTALNLATQLDSAGILREFGVIMLGATAEVIKRAEDRLSFKKIMQEIGVDIPKSGVANTLQEAMSLIKEIGFPAIIRPAYTLGGSGSGIAYNIEEYREIASRGLFLSPISEILVEECLLGWKEFELEVMRDCADNFVVICSIENLDPMGVHTGDSITVAPIQTLTDKEYQDMRDDARKIISAIGVDTGGSNIQFGVNPKTGRRVAIEMNPRVSRSSALASKATGFPIAKIAAKLAVGYRLDELPNDITKKTPACFEPTIDYCVVKIPRFTFEKFPGASPYLGSQMKSVGETMAIGRTFKEALQKGLRGLETGRHGLGSDGKKLASDAPLILKLRMPNPDRIFYLREAIREGFTNHEIFELSGIDPWFIENIREIISVEDDLKNSQILKTSLSSYASKVRLEKPRDEWEKEELRLLQRHLIKAKQNGFSDAQISYLTEIKNTMIIRAFRKELGITACYKAVDTCGGEFEAQTPYFYSTYDGNTESVPSTRSKIVILGGGPNRIGQGIEFDYCCVQAAFALKKEGYEVIMVNSNPETVSTDYDTSDKLYFEPVTAEDVLNIIDAEKPEGVIVQFGGQTPLNIAKALQSQGVIILGTSPESIDIAENREKFGVLAKQIGLLTPEHGTGFNFEQVRETAEKIGYPVMVRPSYVLGGRAMEIVYTEEKLKEYISRAVDISDEHPVLVDKFLIDATEVDVDALADGEQVVIAAIMEHIEAAGIHSGDSACVIPSRTLSAKVLETIRRQTRDLGMALKVKGLMNIQFAVKDEQVYVLEVNPRASRTVPYVSKAVGVPIAQIAARIMAGRKLEEMGFTQEPKIRHYAVKEAVLPFNKFPGCQISLGPEMRSTGEVMGIDPDFGRAFAKSQIAALVSLPMQGGIFISIADKDKPAFLPVAKRFFEMGFELLATRGTAEFLKKNDISTTLCEKISEGRPNVLDYMINNKVQLVINTTRGIESTPDEYQIRSNALIRDLPLITTIAAARAAAEGIASLKEGPPAIQSLQDYHK